MIQTMTFLELSKKAAELQSKVVEECTFKPAISAGIPVLDCDDRILNTKSIE